MPYGKRFLVPFLSFLLLSLTPSLWAGEREDSLIEAASKGDSRKAAQLLAEGVDVNATDKHGFTVLMFAAYNGSKDIVDLLISKGANVNARDTYGFTSLMLAVTSSTEAACSSDAAAPIQLTLIILQPWPRDGLL